MKRIKTIFAALLISSLGSFAAMPSLSNTGFLKAHEKAGKDLLKVKKPAFFSRSGSGLGPGDINGGGLFINAGIFLPSAGYLNDKLFKFGYDAEWGHFFKIIKVSKFSVGLRLTWLSGSYTSYKDITTVSAIGASPVRVGPQFIFALKEKLAINLFYQIGGNYTVVLDDGQNYSFIGLTHEVGAGLQYRILNIGMGYRFGNLKNIHNSDGPTISGNWAVNGLRVYVGIKL